jgi:hypothetical protein
LELGDGDSALLEESDGRYKLAEVPPVAMRENTVQKRRTIAKDINQKLPSLVPTGNLLRRVPRRAIKRSR